MSTSANLPRLLADVVARGDLVIPPYPAAALRLRRIVERDDFGLAEVADAAAADPALAAALLRVANSALYQSQGPVITTLGRAVHRLGARSVAAIATAAAVGSGATAPGPLIDVKYRVWRRSVTCALACQRFADRNVVDPDEAFLAGLLHGFGRCVAVACLERLLPSLPQKSMSLIEWMEAAEPHRAELARAVARQWQLPEPLLNAVGTDDAPNKPLATLIALGERLAAAVEHGRSMDAIVADLRGEVEPRALQTFIEGLPSAIEALAQPPEPSKRPRAPSAVTKPETALPGELRASGIEVFDVRSRREPLKLVAVAVGPDGVVVQSQKPMQESCVVRLAFGSGGQTVEGWFNVALCLPERTHFRVECQPFAPTRELRQFLTDVAAKSPPLRARGKAS